MRLLVDRRRRGCSDTTCCARASAAGTSSWRVDLPELDITDAAAVDGCSRAAGRSGVAGRRSSTARRGRTSTAPRASASRRRPSTRDGAGNLARAPRRGSGPAACTCPPTTCSTAWRRSTRDGRPRPYVESDPTGPRSVYGATKLEGEHQVLAASPRHTIVRTAWLYGVDGHELRRDDAAAGRRARRGAGRDRPDRLADLVGAPRAGAARPARAPGRSGLVHLTGAGEVSWNGFAQEIFRQAEVALRGAGGHQRADGRAGAAPGVVGAGVTSAMTCCRCPTGATAWRGTSRRAAGMIRA